MTELTPWTFSDSLPFDVFTDRHLGFPQITSNRLYPSMSVVALFSLGLIITRYFEWLSDRSYTAG